MSNAAKAAYREIMRGASGDSFFAQDLLPHFNGEFDSELNDDIVDMQLMGIL